MIQSITKQSLDLLLRAIRETLASGGDFLLRNCFLCACANHGPFVNLRTAHLSILGQGYHTSGNRFQLIFEFILSTLRSCLVLGKAELKKV